MLGTQREPEFEKAHSFFENLLTRFSPQGTKPKDLGFNHSVMECRPVDDLPTPTARELEILKVLWEQGASSVRTVHRFLARFNSDLAYNTVQTLLRIMEEKGLVGHDVEGRTFIYTPLFTREESAARFVDRVFDGAASQLVLSLLRSEQLTTEELDAMQAMIAQARRKKASR